MYRVEGVTTSTYFVATTLFSLTKPKSLNLLNPLRNSPTNPKIVRYNAVRILKRGNWTTDEREEPSC